MRTFTFAQVTFSDHHCSFIRVFSLVGNPSHSFLHLALALLHLTHAHALCTHASPHAPFCPPLPPSLTLSLTPLTSHNHRTSLIHCISQYMLHRSPCRCCPARASFVVLAFAFAVRFPPLYQHCARGRSPRTRRCTCLSSHIRRVRQIDAGVFLVREPTYGIPLTEAARARDFGPSDVEARCGLFVTHLGRPLCCERKSD
ncbi:hypothetical protein C8Q80DRAFT_800213 [Daedaleopsis nitida]|nr:hypothetical protein C8Q80DRAFT_800213 [Daedaleopsis nitida]